MRIINPNKSSIRKKNSNYYNERWAITKKIIKGDYSYFDDPANKTYHNKKKREFSKINIKPNFKTKILNKLKNRATFTEKKLKKELEKLRIIFSFQQMFDTEFAFYITDFYFPDSNLIVELDGEYHNKIQQQHFDILRENKLRKLYNVNIIRFTNKQVVKDIDLVIFSISKNLSTKSFR